jgi:hypothetical protein
MPVQFPSNPSPNETYVYPGLPAASVYWQWNGFGWAFRGATGGVEPPSALVPGQTQIVLFQSYENQGIPMGADTGALWFNTDSGILYTYVGGQYRI